MALILMVEWFSDFSRPAIHSNHSFNQRDFIFVDLMGWFGWIYIYTTLLDSINQSINHSLTPSRCIYIYICIHSSIHPATNHITSIHPSIHHSKNEKKIPPVFALPNPNQSEQPNFPHLISIPSHPIPSPHPIYPNTQNKPSLIDTLMLYFIIFSYIILYYITLITYMYNHRSRAHGIE